MLAFRLKEKRGKDDGNRFEYFLDDRRDIDSEKVDCEMRVVPNHTVDFTGQQTHECAGKKEGKNRTRTPTEYEEHHGERCDQTDK